MVDLKHYPALLVIDMQNGFVHPKGSFGKLSMDVPNHRKVIPAIQQLIATFDKKKLPVFFTRLAWKSYYSNCGRLLDKLPVLKDMEGFVEGSWDADIVDELKPAEHHVIINKTRNSAFWKTDLEQRLRESDVEQVIVSGVGTNVCIESTVRDAFTNDFYTLVISDATATLTEEAYQASLKSMAWFGDSATVKEVLDGLDRRNQ